MIAVPLAAATAAATIITGLHGLVTKGPITPVCGEGTACTAPAAHVTLVFARTGFSKRVVTDDRGRYRIALRAGRYSVRTVGYRFGTRPALVTVKLDVFRRVDLSIDTGIR